MTEAIEDYLRREHAGQVDSSGRFTIDVSGALAKLGVHGGSPEHAWLRLVQEAVKAGAQHLEVDLGLHERRLSFDAPAGLLAGALSGVGGTRLDVIPAMVSLHQAYHCCEVTFVEAGGEGYRLAAGDKISLETLSTFEPGPHPICNTHTDSNRPPPHRYTLRLHSGWRDLWGHSAEEKTLQERCLLAPLALKLNGHLITGDLGTPPQAEWLDIHSFKTPLWLAIRSRKGPELAIYHTRHRVLALQEPPSGPTQLWTLPAGLEGPCRVFPVKHGVALDPILGLATVPGLNVYVAAEELPTDLSGFQVRQSPQLERFRRQMSKQIRGFRKWLVNEIPTRKFGPLRGRNEVSMCQGAAVMGSIGALAFNPATVLAGFALMAAGAAGAYTLADLGLKVGAPDSGQLFRYALLERLALGGEPTTR